MKRSVLFYIVLLVSVSQVASAATYESPIRSAQENFQALDTNHDGQVAKDEGPIGLEWPAGRFEMMDLNHNGTLSYDEYMDWSDSPRVQRLADELSTETFAALDVDRDMKISLDEWVGTPAGFKRWDKNHDGSIDISELRSR